MPKVRAFPPSRFRNFPGTIPLSDSRPGQHLKSCCGPRPHTQDGSPTLPKIPFQRAILITPVDENECLYRFLPRLPSAFPVYRAGRHPQLYFRGLLKVHSRYDPSVCSPPMADFCPRSFSRKVSLPDCPGSYRDEPTTSRAELSSTGILHLRGAPIYWGGPVYAKTSVFCYLYCIDQ